MPAAASPGDSGRHEIPKAKSVRKPAVASVEQMAARLESLSVQEGLLTLAQMADALHVDFTRMAVAAGSEETRWVPAGLMQMADLFVRMARLRASEKLTAPAIDLSTLDEPATVATAKAIANELRKRRKP